MSNDLNVTLSFPDGFLWGTATAAHQVEGGNHNSWTAWEDASAAARLGGIFQNHVSGPACDWWNGCAEEDFARAASLNNNALRLSVEWSRIEPEPGRFDEDALARYRAMVIELRALGLEPMVTLHHFTNPVWLEERGAWLNPETPALFARFAARVAEALGDYVTLWCTINEPVVYASLSYLVGKWPPAHHDLDEVLQVIQHMVLGHAAAYHAIKPDHPEAQIGFAKHQIRFVPDGIPGLAQVGVGLLNHLFNEMIFGPFRTGRMRIRPGRSIALPQAVSTLDWIGLQYYNRYAVRFNLQAEGPIPFEQYARPDHPHGPGTWGELAPQESYPLLRQIHRLTKRPIYVTEMGVPDADDSIRPGYLAETLRWVWRACMHSYPVRGFFFWSLVDNFEWAEGYDPRYRFGLYGVDFQTKARTERRSAGLYRAVAGANALTAAMVREYAPEVLHRVFPAPDGA